MREKFEELKDKPYHISSLMDNFIKINPFQCLCFDNCILLKLILSFEKFIKIFLIVTLEERCQLIKFSDRNSTVPACNKILQTLSKNMIGARNLLIFKERHWYRSSRFQSRSYSIYRKLIFSDRFQWQLDKESF